MNDIELEQMLRLATSRSAKAPADEEAATLQRTFRSLGVLLERQQRPVCEAELLEAVLGSDQAIAATAKRSQREGWLAMGALAASLLVFMGLGLWRAGDSTFSI